MKRLIIAILLSTFAQNASFAANNDTCKANTAKAGCNATPGCYWAYTNSDDPSMPPYEHCVVCPYDTYNDGTIGDTATTCKSCGSVGSGVSWVNSFTGKESQGQCTYKADCQPAQYFSLTNNKYTCTACTVNNNSLTSLYYYANGTATYPYAKQASEYASDFSTACSKCGKYSTSNNDGLGCTCYANYHVSGGGNNDTQNDNKDCEANTYKITLNDNGGSGGSGTIHEVYNTKWTNGSGTIITNVNIPVLTGRTFMGYFSYPNNRTPEIGINGTLPSHTTFTADTTLTAKWENKTFTITYDVYDATLCDISQQNCSYNSQSCAAANPAKCVKAGYIFQYWECTGCTESNKQITYGTNLGTISNGNDIILKAIWQKCPKGHYCTNVMEPTACPAGSTSDGGKTAQTDCYMSGGTTQICDKNSKCFTLPDNSTIYYHNGQ